MKSLPLPSQLPWKIVGDGDAEMRSPLRVRGLTLAWRAFLSNAAVLIAAFAFYVASPATISAPVATRELLVVVAAIVVSLFVNLVLLRRTFAPLDRLVALMRRVDPLSPGQRVQMEQAEAEVAALSDAFNEMLDRLETERRESARRALGAQESERIRIFRELHDELGQRLTGVLLILDQAAKSDGPESRAAVEEAREAARGTLDELRRIARDLRPEALDDLGLVSALTSLATGFAQHAHVPVRRRLPAQLPGLTSEQELVVYRVAQEALTNVARHADARHVEIGLDHDQDVVRLTVRDDGRGFRGPLNGEGGLRGMKERALLVRGAVAVESAPGAGTLVRLDLPVTQERRP